MVKSRLGYEVFSLFWVMNSCEPDYSDSAYLQEYWGVYSSLAFLVPPMFRLVVLWPIPINEKLKRCYLSLVLVAFASGLFHSYVSYPTQAIDMTAILIAELCYAKALNLSISRSQEVFMWITYSTILFTPIFASVTIGLLFVQFFSFTFKKFKEIKQTALRVTALISLFSILGAVLCIPLDLMCNSPLLYHSYWHLLIALFCFSGAVSAELLYRLELVKSD